MYPAHVYLKLCKFISSEDLSYKAAKYFVCASITERLDRGAKEGFRLDRQASANDVKLCLSGPTSPPNVHTGPSVQIALS